MPYLLKYSDSRLRIYKLSNDRSGNDTANNIGREP